MTELRTMISDFSKMCLQVEPSEPKIMVNTIFNHFNYVTGKTLIWSDDEIYISDYYRKEVCLNNKMLGNIYINNSHLTAEIQVLIDFVATILAFALYNVKNDNELSLITAKKLRDTLSYTEIKCAKVILNELLKDNTESKLLVASKIADKNDYTRSVIVNAIRKMESASIIDSKNLGVKGTKINIINKKAVEKLLELVG